METLSVLLKGSVMRSFGVSFDVNLNKLLDKKSIHRWVQTPHDDHVRSL